MDFVAELQKLLEDEIYPPQDVLAEIAGAHMALLESINRRGGDISLQVEEIYDIVKQSDESAKEAGAAAKRENLLLGGLISMGDMFDDVLRYLQRAGTGGVEMLASQRDAAMDQCGLERLGYLGERLDPQLHAVASAEFGDAPIETIVQVLVSGYAYRGSVIRKASVIVSKGGEEA